MPLPLFGKTIPNGCWMCWKVLAAHTIADTMPSETEGDFAQPAHGTTCKLSLKFKLKLDYFNKLRSKLKLCIIHINLSSLSY
jgi:hypothetical protein